MIHTTRPRNLRRVVLRPGPAALAPHVYTCMNFPGADKADCSFIITNIVSGSSSWASTRRRRRRRGRGGARQGTYYLLTAKGVPVDPVEVNPPPPPAPGRRAAWDLLELPAHSKRWCPRPGQPSAATASASAQGWTAGHCVAIQGGMAVYAHASTACTGARTWAAASAGASS